MVDDQIQEVCIDQLINELSLDIDNEMKVDSKVLFDGYFNNQNRISSIHDQGIDNNEDSNWVDLIINPINGELEENQENIDTNILLNSSIKRLTEAQKAQIEAESKMSKGDHNIQPFKSSMKSNRQETHILSNKK